MAKKKDSAKRESLMDTPNENVTATRTMEDVVSDLEDAMQSMTIRQLSVVTGAGYNSLLKASKAPQQGKIYNPDDVNYRAMVSVLVRKLGTDEVLALNWDDLKKAAEVVGDNPPIVLDVKVGDIIRLRPVVTKKGDVITYPDYRVHIVTPTHIVVMADDSTQPRVMSNTTFKHCGGKVVTEEA